MRWSRTQSRYVAREVAADPLIGLAAIGVGLSLSTLALGLEGEPAATARPMWIRGSAVEPGPFHPVGDRALYRANRLRGNRISDRTDPERRFRVFTESGEITSGRAEMLRQQPSTYATPLARRDAPPSLFAIAGVPLAIRRKRAARSDLVILCAAVPFGYGALESLRESLATDKGFPPQLATGLPNIAVAVAGLARLVRARRSS